MNDGEEKHNTGFLALVRCIRLLGMQCTACRPGLRITGLSVVWDQKLIRSGDWDQVGSEGDQMIAKIRDVRKPVMSIST